jgi:rhodanese-related sulfurtransferase
MTQAPPLLAQHLAKLNPRIAKLKTEELQLEISKNPNLLIIDIRETQERSQGFIPNSIWVARGYLELQIERIAPMQTDIVIYCAGGTRSLLAADSLQNMGYENVYSLSAGFRGWAELGCPISHD